MEIDQKKLLGFGDVLRRRISYFLVPFLALLVATVLLAFALPVSYESSTKILAEESDIPANIVDTSFTSFVNQRIDELTQLIMSRKTLSELIERYDLYADARQDQTIDDVIETMKEDITFETNSTDVMPQGTGRPMQATLSFTITYKNSDPKLAHQVTNELANLYVSQNTSKIERRLDETSAYLETKKKELEEKITALEKSIAAFKELHVNQMPDLLQTNLQNLRSVEAEIETQAGQILSLRQRKSELEGDLKKTKPHASFIQPTGEKVVDPEDQLDALRFEYISKRATMSDKHPDILNLKKEIAELEKVVSRKQKLIDTEKKYNTLRTEFAETSGRLSPQHPDMITLSRQIEEVRREIETLSRELASNQETAARTPDNPAYIELQTQLKIAELNLKEAGEKLARLDARRRVLQDQITATPLVEKAYLDLTRDYDTLKQQYQDILTKISDARDAKGIDEERKGQKFTILDSANLPETPSEPDVPIIFLLGLVLSLSVGFGSVYLAELADTSVRSMEELQSATGVPVLSAIPYVKDAGDRRRKILRRTMAIVLALLFLFFALWAIYYHQATYM